MTGAASAEPAGPSSTAAAATRPMVTPMWRSRCRVFILPSKGPPGLSLVAVVEGVRRELTPRRLLVERRQLAHVSQG